MRKRIYIKLIPVAVAWIIVLLHGIIPHNHYDDKPCNLMNIAHHGESCTLQSEYASISYSINGSVNHEEHACHFAPNLFHEDSSFSSFLFVSPLKIDLSAQLVNPHLPGLVSFVYRPPPKTDGNSLRAPPPAA